MLDMTFGFSRQHQHVYGPDFNSGNYGLEVLQIPGTNDQGIGDQRYAGYPHFNTGFSAVGNRDGWNPIFRDERTYSLAANITKLKGRHDLRGGYFVNFMYLDHWQPETGNPRGEFHVQWQYHWAERRDSRRPISTTSTPRSCSASSATSIRACRTS